MRLIDADALVKALEKFSDTMTDYRVGEGVWDALGFVKDAPTIEPKKGKWVEDEYWDYKCSACGKGIDDDIYRFMPYCPNCGAKMERSEE